jgi:hypothetical protein
MEQRVKELLDKRRKQVRQELTTEYQDLISKKEMCKDYYERAVADRRLKVINKVKQIITDSKYHLNQYYNRIDVYGDKGLIITLIDINGYEISDEIRIVRVYDMVNNTDNQDIKNLMDLLDDCISSAFDSDTETQMITLYYKKAQDKVDEIWKFKQRIKEDIYDDTFNNLIEGKIINGTFKTYIGGKNHKEITSMEYKLNPSGRSGTLIIKSELTSKSGMLFKNYGIQNVSNLIDSYSWDKLHRFIEDIS